MKFNRHFYIKLVLVSIIVPLFTFGIVAAAKEIGLEPDKVVTYFASGTFFSYMLVTFYDRMILKKEASYFSYIKQNKEDLELVKSEMEEVKAIISENAASDVSYDEIAVTASIKRGQAERTIVKGGNDDPFK